MSGSEDPLVADQTSPTQQLLGATLVQHHLPVRSTGNNFKVQIIIIIIIGYLIYK